MDRNKQARIHIESFSQTLDTASLFLVYQPLCGIGAIGLYGTLVHLSLPDSFTHDQLAALLNLTHDQLVKDFEALEQVMLVESFHHPVQDTYLYVVKPPLKIAEALNHPVLGRAYLQLVGESHFASVKKRYTAGKSVMDGYQSISKPFETSRLKSYDPVKESHFDPQEAPLSGLRFNMLSFKQRCAELVFPQALRTPENLNLIEELGSVYGISVPKMVQLIGECVNIAAMTFDSEKLDSLIRKQHEPSAMPEDPYDAEPVQFLRYLSDGREPTDTEKRLIAGLVRDLRLNPAVVNVLIKHALDTSNQSLKKSYVETIASSWSRLKITTKQQALDHIAGLTKKPEKGRKEAVPDYQTDKSPLSNSEVEALKARLKKMGGSHGKD